MNKSITLLVILFFLSCSSEETTLPILGEKLIDPTTGKATHYKAPEFELTNQLNQLVSNQSFENKIQIIDFFFTSCPTICPKMTQHLKKVEEAFVDENNVAIISYSIDSIHDTPERLRNYAKQYNINNNKWSLLTGERDIIFELAKDYKVYAFDDSYSGTENNLIHDGTFVLVDEQRHIRGYYNGLELNDVKRLINDIKKLL